MAASSPPFERSTIEHVASAAGVSVATVSRALRGLPNVAEATRARVRKVAGELNYRADPAASRLAAGRSRTVAVVVPLINSWYFSNAVAGAEAVCAEDGYDLLVVTAHTVATSEALHRRVDGLIFVEVPLGPDDIRELRHRDLEVVTIGHDNGTFSSIHIDNVGIGRMAVGHLVSLGHRRIGILGAQAEEAPYFDVPQRRIDGARHELESAGLTLEPELVVHGEFTVDGGRQSAHRLLQRRQRPTALFALSDEMAFGAMIAARDLGLDVPADVSLVGVDDHDVSQVVGLTTVRQGVVGHGALAARMLLDRLAGRNPAGDDADAAELVVRSTTRPLAG